MGTEPERWWCPDCAARHPRREPSDDPRWACSNPSCEDFQAATVPPAVPAGGQAEEEGGGDRGAQVLAALEANPEWRRQMDESAEYFPLVQAVAEALWGDGAGDFNEATGYTISHESERIARHLHERGYRLVPANSYIIPEADLMALVKKAALEALRLQAAANASAAPSVGEGTDQ